MKSKKYIFSSNVNPERIYFGDIMKFQQNSLNISNKLIKKNATLIEVVPDRGFYVDIDNIKNIIDLWKINRRIHKDGSITIQKPILDSIPSPFSKSSVYVKSNTLEQNTEIKEDISIWQLKKKMKVK